MGLVPHPEGGYYKEFYRSPHIVSVPAGQRPAVTSIYFQLRRADVSRFHRLIHDEVWCWHEGGSATIHCIAEDGTYSELRVGPASVDGSDYSAVIPAGCWFGATTEDDHVMVTAIVAPGFDFADFELADKEALLAKYGQHADIINRLT